MAWADFETLLKAVCKDVNESHKSASLNTPNIIGTAEALIEAADVLGTEGHKALTDAVSADRTRLRGLSAGWAAKMDAALAYGGTQLTTPSQHVRGDKPTDRRMLLRDINSYMLTNSLSVAQRAVTFAAEPAAGDNGIMDRLTVDEWGVTIEAGLHNQTVDVQVLEVPTRYKHVVRVKPRQSGVDVFNLLGPSGYVDITAPNDAASGEGGIVSNPNLTGTNTTTDEGAVTSCTGWTLSSPSGSPTHLWDTGIAYRGNAGSHKLYGNSTTRRFSQPLVVKTAHLYTPRNYMLAVYKTGTPVGNITLTWGGKSQVFTMGGLSAGWNYLRLDRDRDLWPSQFASSDAALQVDFEFTSGSDASNYINLAGIFGQVYKRFDGAWYGVWSRNGVATALGSVGSFADTMTTAGKNQTALWLAYYDLPDVRDFAYLRSSGSPTLADYT